MKRKLIISLLFLCFCVCVIGVGDSKVYANALIEQKIVVKGVGEVYISPDMATISVGVETLNMDVVKAENENSLIVNNLISVLIYNNIEKKNIKTSNYSIYKKQDYLTQSVLGYQVTNNMDITIYDLQSAGNLISELTKNGANVLRGVSFSIKNKEDAEAEAFKLALNSAKSKALILGGENFVVSKIVEDGIYNSFPVRSDTAFLMSASNEGNVLAGECVVRVNLTVEFNKI